jgi:nitroreductase
MTAFTHQEIDTLCRAIAHRRSLGLARYLPEKPVAPCLVERMLRAADCAPSHNETEPWQFTVFMGESRRALGKAFGEVYRQEADAGFRQDAYEAHCNFARRCAGPARAESSNSSVALDKEGDNHPR